MGLDMYLYVTTYKSKSIFRDNKSVVYPECLQGFEKSLLDRSGMSIYTRYQVGYWRKFYTLHKYIIDNYGDDCEDILLTEQAIDNIISSCEHALADYNTAKEFLFRPGEFIFEEYEDANILYDEIRYTLNLFTEVKELIQTYKEYTVYYRASW